MPNLLSYVRLVGVPVFAWAFLTGRAGLAAAIFIGAALTDGLDGLLARALRQESALGAILDPLADKLLSVVAIALLTFAGALPVWLFVLVAVKEAGTLAGAGVLRARGREVPAPRRLGKYSTFAFALAVGLALVARAGATSAAPFVPATALLAVLCACAAAMQYFARWRRLLRTPPPPRPPRPAPFPHPLRAPGR